MIDLFNVLLPFPFAHGFFARNILVPAKALESYLDLRSLVKENVLVSAVHLSLVSGFFYILALSSSFLYLLYFYLVLREFTEPTSDKLLPDLHPQEQHVFTLVLDLNENETLLYTDWKREKGWRTFKRPGVDAFLEHLGKFYEIVVCSDQMNMDLSKLNRDPRKILYVSALAFDSSLQPENLLTV
ncbi:hypothetical protein REPUB_Repub15cG0122900 [Reevesia pubescens]